MTAFLDRIVAFNHLINVVISLNPEALREADILDQFMLAGNLSGRLHCVPVLLKDNFDTANTPTTGGCLKLKASQPLIDAPVVKYLKDAGAIILGKANMHELALEGLTVSSVGGQTLNPFDFSRTSGGSSGGSAAAVAVSFSVFATGTDTMNSLRNPASANSLYSIRPSWGLVSRVGIIPVSYTQDAVGPIGRTVEDIATALTVMAAQIPEPEDNSTASIPKLLRGHDYGLNLEGVALNTLKIGVVTSLFNRSISPETTPVNVVVDGFIAILQAAGVTFVPISSSEYDVPLILAQCDTQRYEYRQCMNTYLQRPALKGRHPQTLDELYDTEASSDGQFLVIPRQYDQVRSSLWSSTDNDTYPVVQSNIKKLKVALRNTFETNHLDALIYPQQQNLVVPVGSASQIGRNGILAAVTGSPVVTIPAGFSEATDTAPIGLPVGIEILGLPWTDQKLLNIALEIQCLLPRRKPPLWAAEVVEGAGLSKVPVLNPDRQNVSPRYPLGKLR